MTKLLTEKNMKSTAIISFGRKQSERCKNKMLRDFNTTTLTDIMLEKLGSSKFETFFAGFDEEFRNKADKHGVQFLQRTEKSSIIDEPIAEILSFLQDINHENILLVNPCLPMLKLNTIESFLESCIEHGEEASFSISLENNYFMMDENTPINFDPNLKTINTKDVNGIYSFSHALYYFNREYFLSNGRYWDWNKVRFVKMGNKYELFDVDTENDFIMAEALFTNSEYI